MYLLDTDVISEARKGGKANPGVRYFFQDASRDDAPLYLSVITIGELRMGVELIRHRGDEPQAQQLERWLDRVSRPFEGGFSFVATTPQFSTSWWKILCKRRKVLT